MNARRTDRQTDRQRDQSGKESRLKYDWETSSVEDGSEAGKPKYGRRKVRGCFHDVYGVERNEIRRF